MNRLKKLFDNKKDHILSIFFTAGYPKRDDTLEIIRHLDQAGVDLIEIGFPFSDPLADGPVIQRSSQQAIRNGMTLALLFKQLEDLRKITDVPVLLMGYLNPVLQYGPKKFVEKCAEVGVDGFIIPDLPESFYEKQLKVASQKEGLARIRLITPGATDERIREIDSTSDGFNYVVSSYGITGGSKSIGDQAEYFERVNRLVLKNPLIIGFGVHNRASFEAACKFSSGAIVGSEFIRHLEKGDTLQGVSNFVKSISSRFQISN
jgi:tryptophan synthase alpha chain